MEYKIGLGEVRNCTLCKNCPPVHCLEDDEDFLPKRVSENCQLLTELYVVPDEFNCQESWFEDRHLQEIIILLRDPIKSKVVSYYEQTRRKKWSGIKEGNDSKKKPIPDEHQITTGQSVKIGYKFVDSNLHHHSCLMPTELGTPVWKDDNSRHAGGGFSCARLFAKKLVVFVCKYHPATIGQTTSQLMRSLCATPPSKHIAISSYFAPKTDDDFVVGPPVTDSAHRKRNKLRKIVKGMNTAAAVGTKENADVKGKLKGGGFFEKESEDRDAETADTETADEIKPEALASPSISDMDCNSDGTPDTKEQKDRPDNDYRPTECNDSVSGRHGDRTSRSLPPSPQEGRSLKATVTSCVKPHEDHNKADERDHHNYSDVSKHTCKPETIEDTAADLHKEADVSSSEGTSSLPSYESHMKDSLNSTKSDVTLQSSLGQESGVGRLTWTSEMMESSPSSSGGFDHRPRRKLNARSRSKLSLKRNETKKGCANKVRSSIEKMLHEDVIKECVEEASVDQDVHADREEDGSKKLKGHPNKVSMNDNATAYKRSNCFSETVGHPTSNCSVVLKDIKISDPDKSWDDSAGTMKSSMKRPIRNQQETSSSPEKETTPNSSFDDELMSASFLYVKKRPEDSVKELQGSSHQSPLQTTWCGDRGRSGIGKEDLFSNGYEHRDTCHSTSKKSVESEEHNESQRKKRLKQSRLALSDRQKYKDEDQVQNVPKQPSHGEKKTGQRTKIQKLMKDLDWDSDSQGTTENERTSKVIHSCKIDDKWRGSDKDEPMDVGDASPKTAPVEEAGCVSDEVEALSSDHCKLNGDQDPSMSDLKQDDLVHISDDSCGGDTRETKQAEEEGNAAGGASQEGRLGDLDDDVIDLSQGTDDDDDESDSWFDNIFGNVRLVTELKIADIVYLTQRNKKYLHSIFQGKRACERHQCYKKKGPHRIGMASNVRLGPFKEEQMDAVMGELVKVYCTKHFKYMDYLSKVLLPEAMTKIYIDVHGVSHTQAEEVMKGVQKEHPRAT